MALNVHEIDRPTPECASSDWLNRPLIARSARLGTLSWGSNDAAKMRVSV